LCKWNRGAFGHRVIENPFHLTGSLPRQFALLLTQLPLLLAEFPLFLA
jgi:hypothetical protein